MTLGSLTLNADGTWSYTANPGVEGTDTFTYTAQDGDGDQTTADITIDVIFAGEPTVGLMVNGDGYFKEDTPNDVTISAAVADSSDQLTSVVVTGLTWGVSGGELTDLIADANVSNATFAAGTLTINFNAGVEIFTYSALTLTPPADTDVDLTGIQITANVEDKVDNSVTNSGSDTATFVVDAILDFAADATQTSAPSVDESTSGSQTILLNLDYTMPNAGFTGSGAGGQDTDGSESVSSVTISISAGTLVLDSGYGGSASLTDNGGGNYTLTGWTNLADLETAVEALSVTVGEGFDGSVTGTLSMTTKEANTPQGTVPASGGEPDITDNVVTNDVPFSVTVNPTASPPDASVTVNGDGYFKEDVPNDVTLHAQVGDPTDQLTSVVVQGLSGWTVDAADLTALNALSDVNTATFVGGTLTITFNAGVETFDFTTLTLTPPADTDVDSDITITANVEDKTDNSATDTFTSAPTTLVVDAVLDQAADPSQSGGALNETELATQQTFALNMDASLVSAGFTYSGAGGADGDGSESITRIFIDFDAVSGAALILNGAPGGVTLVAAGGDAPAGTEYEIVGFTTDADAILALQALSLQVDGSIDGTFTGSVTIRTAEANTPPDSTVPASGQEPDTTDNVKDLTGGFTVNVADGAGPSGGTLSLTVDESALDLVKDPADLQAGTVVGTDPSSPAETDSGLLHFAAGSDPISDIYFGDTTGILVTDELGNPVNGITWTGNGTDTLTGTLGGIVVIVLALSGSQTALAGGSTDVTVTATLTDAFPHAYGDTSSTGIGIDGIAVEAIDSDGTTGSGTVDVTVLDDAPLDITADPALVANTGDAVGYGDLNFLGFVGADQPGDVVFVNNNLDSVLRTTGDVAITTVDGYGILLDGFGTHTLTGWADVDGSGTVNAGDTMAFTVTLDPVADTYTIDFLQKLDDGSGLDFSSLSNVAPGKNDFFNVEGTDGGSPPDNDLVITALNISSGVNTSNALPGGAIGVGSQSVVPGTGVRLDFVHNAAGAEKHIANLTFDDHSLINGAEFQLAQFHQGSTADVSVELLDTASTDGTDFLTAVTTPVEVSAVVINGTEVWQNGSGDLNGTDAYTFNWSAGPGSNVIGISGLADGDIVQVFGATTFDRVQITNDSTNTTFDMGNFGAGSSAQGGELALSLDLTVTDQDGDTSSGTLDMTTFPDGNAHILGTAADETLIGGSGMETLTGAGGDDTLTGGTNADTFVFSLAANDGHDTITDFSHASDVLSFTDVVDTGASGLDINDLTAAISSVSDAGPGGDVTVSFNDGASIVFAGVGTGSITTINQLVDDANTQIHVS